MSEYLDATDLGNEFTFADLNGVIEQYFTSLEAAPKPFLLSDPSYILMTQEQLDRYDSMLLWGRSGAPRYRGLPIVVAGESSPSIVKHE
jgi:hypothetical protein